MIGGTAWEWLSRLTGGENDRDDDGWNAGQVFHILPIVSHSRIRLKVSLKESLSAPPQLWIGSKATVALAGCTGGKHWIFDADDLPADTVHTLKLQTAAGEDLCDSWNLKTFPAPESQPERFRLLAYSCAGGPEFFIDTKLNRAFLPMRLRRKLLQRALDFHPDAIVANGDHVYWDRKSRMGWGMGESPMARWKSGIFDPSLPADADANLRIIQKGLGDQIAGLYRTMFRNCPVFFIQDDHDFLENDEIVDGAALFPPNDFRRAIADLTQRLFYPEFLSHETSPTRIHTTESTSLHFGTLRYGRLFEGLLFGCRCEMDVSTSGYFVPPDIEQWIIKRHAESSADHVVQFPSCPYLWTVGKWGEWYPDALDDSGELGLNASKPLWREAWFEQHNRLINAACAKADRVPLTVSGDLHASAVGSIKQSGENDFRGNPIVSVLPGAIGTGPVGWPSHFRGYVAQPSKAVAASQSAPPRELNGFSLLDFTPNDVTVSLFAWEPTSGEQAIASLQPFHVESFTRQGES